MRLLDDDGSILDAELDVVPTARGVDFYMHSRSGGASGRIHRNSDYFVALERLLGRLSGVGATIDEVAVDSTVARKLPPDDRIVDLPYPVALSAVDDIPALRRRITEGQRTIASTSSGATHRGNNHKRIRIGVDLLSSQLDAQDLLRTLRPADDMSTPKGRSYRRAAEDPRVRAAELFTFDPATRERGLAAHSQVQNALADHLVASGLHPFSPEDDEPDYDLGWIYGSQFYVVEVKSLGALSISHQLRLGLGQVLFYRRALMGKFAVVHAVLAVEFEPPPIWVDVCTDAGVRLTWPTGWPRLLS